jgi:DNA topoisomerase-1
MLRKEILMVRRKCHYVGIGKLRKLLKENTGSDKERLVPTDIRTFTDFLVKNFEILDYNFTAKVEQDFDEIAEGNVDW